MSLIKISRNYQVTIPAKMRGDLGVKEGDYLDVSIKNGTIIFSPVTPVPVKVSNKKNSKPEKQK